MPYRYEPPEAPTWRKYLEGNGQRIEKLSDYRRLWRENCVSPREVEEVMPDQSWIDTWDLRLAPAAKAFNLLEKLDLGPKLGGPGRKAGSLAFEEFHRPGSSERWVKAKDALTVSLLQARLIALNLPIKVLMGDENDM